MRKKIFIFSITLLLIVILNISISQNDNQNQSKTDPKLNAPQPADFQKISPSPSAGQVQKTPRPIQDLDGYGTPPPYVSPTPTPTPTPIGENELHIFYAGNRRSEVENCGCKGKNVGGLEYEIGFYQKQKSNGINFITLDSGGFIDIFLNPLEKLKSKYMLDSLNTLPYNVMNVTVDDLGIGLDFLKNYRDKSKIYFVSANIVDPEGKEIFKPYKIIEVPMGKEKIKIGVIGITKTPAPVYTPSNTGLLRPPQTINAPKIQQPAVPQSPNTPNIQRKAPDLPIPTPPPAFTPVNPPTNDQSSEIIDNEYYGFDGNPVHRLQTESRDAIKKKEEIQKMREEFKRKQAEYMKRMSAQTQTTYNPPAPKIINETQYNINSLPNPNPTVSPTKEKPVWNQINMDNKETIERKTDFAAANEDIYYSSDEESRTGLGGSGDPSEANIPSAAAKPSQTDEIKPPYKILNEIEVLPKVVEQVRKKCDLVIVLSYTGINAAKVLASQVQGIDIIISGNYDRIMPIPERVNNTYIIHPGYQGKYISDLSLGLEKGEKGKWKIANLNGVRIDVYKDTMPADPVVTKMLLEYKKESKNVNLQQ